MKGEYAVLLLVLVISLGIGFFWEDLDFVREAVNSVFNPTVGKLIEWNTFIGFLITVAIIALILTFTQKFLTDQKELKRLKAEQKEIQKEMKEFKEHPERTKDLNIKNLELAGKMMKHSFGSFTYTAIPIIVFFRWFQEVLSPIYGGWWILYYIIATMIFSIIFRKIFKVA